MNIMASKITGNLAVFLFICLFSPLLKEAPILRISNTYVSGVCPSNTTNNEGIVSMSWRDHINCGRVWVYAVIIFETVRGGSPYDSIAYLCHTVTDLAFPLLVKTRYCCNSIRFW